MTGALQLRVFCHLDRIQPQFAAFVGAVAMGAPAVEGMSSLYVEMSPANVVFPVLDKVLKEVDVEPGIQAVERRYGMFEVHSDDQAEVLRAGDVALGVLGTGIESRVRPRVVSTEVVTNVHPRQAQVLNRMNEGTMIEGGQTMLVMEVEPAAYIVAAANEAEKAAPVHLNHLTTVGVFGRMWMAGTEADIIVSREAAIAAIHSVTGQEE